MRLAEDRETPANLVSGQADRVRPVAPDDFFDSDWEETGGTQETAVTRPSGGGQDPGAEPPRRPPRGPRRPPSLGQLRPGSLPPLQYRRLAGLADGILAVVVVLVLLARGCSG